MTDKETKLTWFDYVAGAFVLIGVLAFIYSVFLFVWKDDPSSFDRKVFVSSALMVVMGALALKISAEIEDK